LEPISNEGNSPGIGLASENHLPKSIILSSYEHIGFISPFKEIFCQINITTEGGSEDSFCGHETAFLNVYILSIYFHSFNRFFYDSATALGFFPVKKSCELRLAWRR